MALLLLAAAAALPLCGCGYGVSQGTSYFPHLMPTGDVVHTHGKPPGPSYYANFDPHAVRIEVYPIEATNPVRTQHVFIATVLDENGQPRRNRRVEWILEGVGNIIEVDESGLFNGRGGKITNNYAVSYTDYHEQTITRGNDDPSDDFVIKPGQTWCVVSSAVEGDSHLTVYCPEIYNWDNHKVFVTKHWVDAEWVFPKPAVNRAGTKHVFTTKVMRHSDHQPLAGYQVRYTIADGPPALFVEGGQGSQTWTATTDLNGDANVTLAQVAPVVGINRVDVEVIRPPAAGASSGVGIIIGKGSTTKEWQAAQIQLTKDGPKTAVRGQNINYLLTVTNSGQVETKALTVSDTIPQGLEFVSADPPPAQRKGNDLVWTMGELPGGQSRTINVVFRSQQLGQVTNTATVVTDEGLKDQKSITTEIVSADLKVKKTGPPTGAVGVPITYEITVTNSGGGQATNVVLQDKFDDGLEHETHANPVELPVGTLDANQSRTVKLTLVPKVAGTLVNRVTAKADGRLVANAEHPVVVSEAKLLLKLAGPREKYVNRPAAYTITVENPSDVPLNNVVVRDQLPPELGFRQASDNGRAENGQVVWSLGTLGPKEKKSVQVQTNCERMTPEAVNVATATADPGVTAQDKLPIEVRGLPAFRFEVSDRDDAVEKGGTVVYQIDVTNQGSLAGNQVQVLGTLPKQMRFLKAEGPSKYKVELLPGRGAGEGETVTFEPVDALKPGETFTYTVEAQALEAGDVRFVGRLKAMQLAGTVTEEESTTIYEPPPGSVPEGAAPPAAAPAPTPAPPVTPAPAAPAPAPTPPGDPGPGLPPPQNTSLSTGQRPRPGTPIATTGPAVVPASAKSSAPAPAPAPGGVNLLAPVPGLAPAVLREPPGTTPIPTAPRP